MYMNKTLMRTCRAKPKIMKKHWTGIRPVRVGSLVEPLFQVKMIDRTFYVMTGFI